MPFTLGQAAIQTGKSKPTILKALRSGRMSGIKVENEWQIEPAELFRVYPRVTEVNPAVNTKASYSVNPDQQLDATEIAVLRAKLEAAEKLDAIRVETIEDQRRRLDRAEARVEALLTDQRGKQDPAQDGARRSWWRRLIGRG